MYMAEAGARQDKKSATESDIDLQGAPSGEQKAYRAYREWCRSLGVPVSDYFTWRKVTRRIPSNQFGPFD
jgi:hypothetical protein